MSTSASRLRARTTIDLRELRVASGLMLTAALAAPLLPGPDGLACPLRSLTGVPCPLCGMTTSVTAAAHLDPLAALAANPVGLLAVIIALALLLFRRKAQATVPVWTLPAVLLFMWIWQLARFDLL